MKKLTNWAKKQPEKKPLRTVEAIDEEFKLQCQKLGEADFQIESLQNRKIHLRNRVTELVLEMQEVNAAQAAEAPKEEVKADGQS